MKKKTREEVVYEIDNFHDTSWIIELLKRNKDRMDYIAIKYRGEKITYAEFFDNVEKYAKALYARGIKKGDSFVAAIPNTPEYIYLVAAASAIGAVINIVSPEFDKDYLKDIINSSTYKDVFISDMYLSEMKDVINSTDKNTVLVPYEGSLKHGNPYKNITEKYYKLDEVKLNSSISELSNGVTNIDEYLLKGNEYNGNIYNTEVRMNDPFTITYSSGSTNSSRPKGILHCAKSYIYMGRYHDQDVSAYPTMKKAVTLACIPTHSNTDLSNCVSDSLMQGGTVACEPIYNEQYFLDSLIINQPTLAIGTRSHWLCAMKKYYKEIIKYHNVKLPEMLAPTSVGEPLEANEEKALNKFLRKVKAGVKYIPGNLPIVTMSVGGGDCEHGGIFFVLFRSLQSKKPRKNIKEPIGMFAYNIVDIKAIRPDGTYCKPYEMGELVCNSPCTMLGYVNNDAENQKFHMVDAYGKKWTRLNTHGYIGENNDVYVKGRILARNNEIPEFAVAVQVLKDTKNILSCEVVKVLDANNETAYVAHIEPQLDKKVSKERIIESAIKRVEKKFGSEFMNHFYIRYRDNELGFPLTGCGKRSNNALREEGLQFAVHYNLNVEEKVKIRKRA